MNLLVIIAQYSLSLLFKFRFHFTMEHFWNGVQSFRLRGWEDSHVKGQGCWLWIQSPEQKQ